MSEAKPKALEGIVLPAEPVFDRDSAQKRIENPKLRSFVWHSSGAGSFWLGVFGMIFFFFVACVLSVAFGAVWILTKASRLLRRT